MESLTPFIRHELEDAPGPSGPPEETSSVVSPPLGAEPGQPPVTEPPKPGHGIQHPGQVVLHTTSQSASQTAPLVGEPLAKRQSFTECQSLPSLGEVALRSNDGEVSIPMTDGTPTACRQKNAAEFLAGRSPGVMAQYGGGLFGAEQHLHSREPAPDEDQSGVLQLVEWREEAPYG